MHVPAALERSRSGNGGHIWIFFSEPVPANLARKLRAHVLTETMERRPDVGLDSYDRFFPNLDTLPQNGFGNLISLPLQKRPRELGHSVFLDERFAPFPDQWEFLSLIRKISRSEIEEKVHFAEAKGRVIGVRFALEGDEEEAPWMTPPSRREINTSIPSPLPETTELILGDLYPQRGVASRPAQPLDPIGGVPKPGVLQSAGHAASNLRQASDY